MAKTYSVNDALSLTRTLAHGVGGLSRIDLTICNLVYGAIWTAFPWGDTVTNIAAGWLPMVDGTQDYNAPTNIYRLLTASLVRTDVSPNQHIDLDVGSNISVDLIKSSPYEIRQAAFQRPIGQLRLERAISIPTGTTFELRGDYQLNPDKLTYTQQGFFFHDQHLTVMAEGLLHWAYKLSDDPRAGSVVKVEAGKAQYSGQLAAFHNAIQLMAQAEDFGNLDPYFPSESLGANAMGYVNPFYGGLF